MQEEANSPCAAKTMRSAVTPAPDEGSKPAIVKTVGFGVEEAKNSSFSHFSQKKMILPGLAQNRRNGP
jgi:hypothetical protein